MTFDVIDIYAHIPSDTEILLTHTPPYEVLDKTRRGKNAGCDVLAARLEQLHACRLHVFGHIHEAHGASIVGEKDGDDVQDRISRVSINAALPSNKRAIVVDLKN
jgi:Icc-related predicted phosphoesterase